MLIREAHCPRCDRLVTVAVVWRGFVWAKRAWYVCLLVVFALMPILLSDIAVLLPTAMLFTLAAGPVHFLAAQKDSCRECGLEVGATAHSSNTQIKGTDSARRTHSRKHTAS